MVTIFKDYKDVSSPHYISINTALERIKNGKSKELIEKIRGGENLKLNLPCILFAGKFKERNNDGILAYSNFLILDFDKQDNRESLKQLPYIYSTWLSPSGNGVKALVKIASGMDYKAHFKALQQDLGGIDSSGSDLARICFESYDPDLYLNTSSTIYTKTVKEEKKKLVIQVPETDEDIAYAKVKKWAENKGEHFTDGTRNVFLMKMAAFCNRVGISQKSCEHYLISDFAHSASGFPLKEAVSVIEKVYQRYKSQFGSARFEKLQILDVNNKIIENIDVQIDIEDVILFSDVYQDLVKLRETGQLRGETTHIAALDNNFRWSRMELTCIHGFGNHGKTTLDLFLMMQKSKNEGYKWCIFSPESYPAHKFYGKLIELWAGQGLDKSRPNFMSNETMKQGYDFINKHFFFIYPQNTSPTPEYILKKYQEVIIKYSVDGVQLDPFNMLDTSIRKSGIRSDEYLGEVFSTFHRFAQNNNIFFHIVAHPKGVVKNKSGKYDCPTVFDLAGGPMWNNKMHNVLSYFRPHFFDHPSDPSGGPYSPIVEIHVQKIKVQPDNGGPGIVELTYDRQTFSFSSTSTNYSNPDKFIEPKHEEEEAPF